MLRQLRKGAKSTLAKILMAFLVVSFAIWGINYSSFSGLRSSIVAQVGDTEITAQRFGTDLEREQQRLSRELRQAVTVDQMRAAGFDRRVLGTLVREAAFREEQKRLGLDAPDSEVARAIRQDPAFSDASGRFDKNTYRYVLSRLGYNESGFEESVRDKLIRRLLEETAAAGVAAPPGVATRIAAWQGEERSATILSLPLDMAPDPGQPDEAALTAFYDANPDMFTEPERRSGDYLHISAAELLKTLEPDEAKLRELYQANQDRFTVAPTRTVDQIVYPDKAAAEAAAKRLLSGEATFESLGAEAGLAETDLSLGTITPKDLPDAAAAALFAVTEPGIVGPVELPAGAAVFRIRALTEASVTPFEEVRDQLAAEQAHDALVYRAPEIANEVDGLRAEGLTFKEIAERAGPAVDHGTFEGLARDGSLPDGGEAEGILASKTLLDEAFAALDGEDRELVETPEGGYVLVMVREIAPSHILDLELVRGRAIAAWQTAERRKAIAAKAAELAARLGENASIWDLGEELGLTPEPLPPFTQLTPPALPIELANTLFKTPAAGGASALAGDGNAAIVAQISGIAPLSPDAIEANAGEVDQLLAKTLREDSVEFFDRAIGSRHPATYNPQVLDEIFRRLGGSVGSDQ